MGSPLTPPPTGEPPPFCRGSSGGSSTTLPSELTSILLDKDILNNTDKARLDNQLRDM